MDDMDNIRDMVKQEIQKEYGHEVSYAKDCQILVNSIRKKTKRQISVSTLKRFFGIIQSEFKPSKYTLDTLAIYLNYKNWEDFLNNFKSNKATSYHQDFWLQLKDRVQIITNQSFKSLNAKIGGQLAKSLVRSFAINRFDAFLNSPQTATAFIAPGGYGKSTIVAQLIDIFFTGKDAKYPNDIVCFIDGSILINLLNLNIEIVHIQNLIDFELKNSFSVFFREHPDRVRGRFILIIESLYEIYYKEEKLTSFVENLLDIISSYKNIDWFKLLITCRPDNWKIFMNLIKNNPSLKSQWFDVNFEGKLADTINIPLLSNDEIELYLENKYSFKGFENLKFHHPEIIEIINTPYLLHLFSLSENPEDIHSDIELLNQFVYNKILTEPFLEEKSAIINSFFHLSEYSKQESSVKKENLKTAAEYNLAYKELVSDNVLYEFTIPGSYLSVVSYVKFANNILLEFFLANKWVEKNKFDLDLIRKVYRFYADKPLLQTNIIKYLIKFAFKESNTNILKDIFTVFESERNLLAPSDSNYVDPEIIFVIGVELRKNKELRDFLIPLYAKSKPGQQLYFESFFDMDSLVLHSGDNIDHYLENKHTTDAKIYGHFLKFMQYFLAVDLDRCTQEYELFQDFTLEDTIPPALAGYYFGAQIIYQSVLSDKPNKKLIEEYNEKANLYFENEIQAKTSIPLFEFIIIYSLNYGNNFNEILQLVTQILSRYVLTDFSYSWYYQLFRAIYARALLNTGEIQQGLELFKKVEFKTIPINYKYYVKLRYNLIKVEFLIVEKQIKKAKHLIEEIKTISQMIRHKLFYDKAIEFEKLIYYDTL